MIHSPPLSPQHATMMSNKIRLHNNNGVRAFLNMLNNISLDTRSDDVMNHFRQALALQFELEQRQEDMELPQYPLTIHSDTKKMDSTILIPNQESSLRRRRRHHRCVSDDDMDDNHPMQPKKMRRINYGGGGSHHGSRSCSTSTSSTTETRVPYLYLRPFLLHPLPIESGITSSTTNHVVTDHCTSYTHIWNSIILIFNLAILHHVSDRSSNKAASLYQVAVSLLQSIPSSSSSFIDRTSNYYFVSMVLYNNYISWYYENDDCMMTPMNNAENDDGIMIHDWMDRMQNLIDHIHWRNDNHYSTDQQNDSSIGNWYYDPQIRCHVQENIQIMTNTSQQQR